MNDEYEYSEMPIEPTSGDQDRFEDADLYIITNWLKPKEEGGPTIRAIHTDVSSNLYKVMVIGETFSEYIANAIKKRDES